MSTWKEMCKKYPWLDHRDIENYIQYDQGWIERTVTISSSHVGKLTLISGTSDISEADIGNNVKISNSVIYNSKIGNGCIIDNSSVTRGAILGVGSKMIAGSHIRGVK